MQLASSQRPHPPPVPPRPSRQVVAEALKRTARLPFPTRQAPPCPNTQPWRLEDHETAVGPQVGRTVVYESGKEYQTNSEQVRCASEPPSLNKLQRPLASPRCCNDDTVAYGSGNNITENTVAVVAKTDERSGGGRGLTRATSERSEAENQRERHQQQPHWRRSSGNERSDRKNSTIQLSKVDSEIPIKVNRRSIPDENGVARNKTENCSVGTSLFGSKKDARKEAKDDGICEEKKKRLLDKLMSRNSDESLKISKQDDKRLLDGSVNESIANSAEVERTENRIVDGRWSQRRSSLFGKKAYSRGESISGTSLSTTPTKVEKKSNAKVNNDGGKVVGVWYADEDLISREARGETASGAATSGSTTTISSDDCATVVIIDEPERKIAFNEDNDNIHHQDWLEAGIRYSSTKITLPGDDPIDRADEFVPFHDNRDNCDDEEYDDARRTYATLDHSSLCTRIAMSSLQGLPPLPRSLSGFNLSEGRREAAEPPPPPTRSSSKTQKNIKSTQTSSSRPSPPGRQLTTLDTQLAILRKEMFGLRQLDLSLLSQLWSLNESIQEFRQLLQEQEDRAPSPSPSSEEGDDNLYGSHPPPPPRRPPPLLHHHRPPRPPRPLRPPASDESPSSEEYGAV